MLLLAPALALLALLPATASRATFPRATPSRTVPEGHDTNAQRLARGLPLIKPAREWSRARKRDPATSPVPTSKGYLYAVQDDGTTAGCVISDGTWYVGGQCATYTQTNANGLSTYTTSKGPCQVTAEGALSCASGNTATQFATSSDGTLSVDSSNVFSADQVPADSVRQTIYTGSSHAVALHLMFSTATATAPSSSSSSVMSASSSSMAPRPTGSGLTVCSNQPVSSFALSCSSSTPADTCCTDSPGGHLLLTQFWDTGATSTGPNNSWTLHGLWPDNCDGTYEQFCDASRELTNITQVLQAAGQNDLLSYMGVYWKDYQGNDESFWEHEYNKHGTCISSLEPQCFNNYFPQEEAVIFFQRAVSTFQTLPSYDWLVQDGIVPSFTATYTLAQIQAALTKHHGYAVNVNCNGNTFDEIWYHYRSQGGVASGNLIASDPVGSGSTCPSTGIRWLPKYESAPASSSAVGPSQTSSAPASSGTIGVGSKGYIYVRQADGTIPSGTGIISDGSWFKGSPATLTLAAGANGLYTMSSSKGLCAIDASSVLTCASTVATGSSFGIAADGTLSYASSTVFSGASVPPANTRVYIHADASQALPVTLQYTLK